jgi:hypothetical protein
LYALSDLTLIKMLAIIWNETEIFTLWLVR